MYVTSVFCTWNCVSRICDNRSIRVKECNYTNYNVTSASALRFAFKWCKYENPTPPLHVHPELCSMCVLLEIHEIQRLEATLFSGIGGFCWTPATLFGKITLLMCHDTPMYCYSHNNITSRQTIAHATQTMKSYVATFSHTRISLSKNKIIKNIKRISRYFTADVIFWTLTATGMDVDVEHWCWTCIQYKYM